MSLRKKGFFRAKLTSWHAGKIKKKQDLYTKWKDKYGRITRGALLRKFLTGGTPQMQIVR